MTCLRQSAKRVVVLLTLVVVAACGGPTSVSVGPSATSNNNDPVPGGGFPGAENTGVPDGVTLKESDGLRISANGAVISDLDIEGCVVVDADDVTIRNTRIRCSDPASANAVQVADGATGLVIEDSEIDGLGGAQIGVGWNNYTLRRVEIHGTADGVRLGSNSVIEDSWIHDLKRQGELHGDAVQSTSGGDILVRHNTLDSVTTDNHDLNNSAIMLGTETGAQLLAEARFEGNYLNGGNYTVNIRGDANIRDVVFIDNVFGPDHRFGPVRAPRGIDFGSDVLQSTGQAVEVKDSAGS
jgi:hypothetical protein